MQNIASYVCVYHSLSQLSPQNAVQLDDIVAVHTTEQDKTIRDKERTAYRAEEEENDDNETDDDEGASKRY